MADTRDEAMAEKEAALKAEIERLLPDSANAVRDKNDVVLIHQDSFAADFRVPSYSETRVSKFAKTT